MEPNIYQELQAEFAKASQNFVKIGELLQTAIVTIMQFIIIHV
jgi:hypothetical protein